MDDTTEEIRRRADIVDIISQYVALRPAGSGRFKACCPFHDEKTPSFNVSQERGFYKCFGCGKSGDVFRFLQEIENIAFPEAKRQLAERYGVTLPRFGKDLSPEQQAAYDERDRLQKITAASAAFFRAQLGGNKGLNGRDYARTRGLSSGTLDRFGIGYAPDAWDGLHHELVNKYGFKPEDAALAGMLIERESVNERSGETFTRYYDRYRHRLMFPIWDAQGRVIAFGGRALAGGETGNPDAKYINSPEGPLFNKSRVLYAWHLARAEAGKRESVIVCEGYMDAIALHEAGFTNTVATLGTALTTQHVALLARLAPKTVYLCYDGDGAGMRAALRSAPLFATHDLNVRVVTLPDGDDPDTFLRKHHAVGFENALRGAKMLARYRAEMAIDGFDLAQVAQRMEAVQAASDVIAEVANDIEKDALVSWLADEWAQSEGVTAPARQQMIAAAVRREVGSAAKRRRAAQFQSNAQAQRQAQFQAQRDQNQNAAPHNETPHDETQGETPNSGAGNAISSTRFTGNADSSAPNNASHNDASNGEFASENSPNRASQNGNFQNGDFHNRNFQNRDSSGGGFRGNSFRGNSFQGNSFQGNSFQGARDFDGDNDFAAQALSQPSGVVKAERMLLAALLGNPNWRSRVLEKLPATSWTQETHREIAQSLRQMDWNEPIEAGVLIDALERDAGDLVGELLMSDEAQSPLTDKIIDDLIARIEGHHARQAEAEILEMVRLKLERNEPISAADHESYNQALIATHRKAAPVPKT